MLIASAKIQSVTEASFHTGFMGNYPTVSHTCLLYLPRRQVFLYVPGVAVRNKSE